MDIPNGFAQVTFTHIVEGSLHPAINVWGASAEGGTNAEGVAEVWGPAYTTNILPVLTEAIVLDQIKVLNWDGTVFEETVNGSGALAGESCPPNVTVLVKKLSGDAGRSRRGRCYMPGVREADVTSAGLLTDDYIGDLGLAWSAFYDEIAGSAVGPPVILHEDESTPTIISRLDVERRVATQRRRLR